MAATGTEILYYDGPTDPYRADSVLNPRPDAKKKSNLFSYVTCYFFHFIHSFVRSYFHSYIAEYKWTCSRSVISSLLLLKF
jgi:hypothetical protein